MSIKHKSSYIFGCVLFSDILHLPNLVCIEKDRLYGIKHTYSETSENELAAVLFVNVKHISRLLEFPTKSTSYIHLLRSHPELQDIAGMNELDVSHYLLSYVYHLLHNLNQYQEQHQQHIQYPHLHKYVVLNIEPKATTPKFALRYPTALITIPGGHLEEQDNGRFLQCARREFEEETKLQILKIDVYGSFVFHKDYLNKGVQFKIESSMVKDPHIQDIVSQSQDRNTMMSLIFVGYIKLKL